MSMYGEHFFHRIAESIPSVSASLLQDCVHLAQRYDEPAFTELCKHKTITPTHAFALASICDPEVRGEVQAKAIQQKWTAQEINREVLDFYGVRRKPGAGRPLKVPKNVSAALNDLNAKMSKFLKTNDSIWFGGEFNISEALGDLNSKLREQITLAVQLCEKLAAAASKNAEELREALDDEIRTEDSGEQKEACVAAG